MILFPADNLFGISNVGEPVNGFGDNGQAATDKNLRYENADRPS